MDRSAGRGLVPEPVAELAARRDGGSGRRRLQAIGLQIVDRKAQGQRRRKTLARARRRFAAEPVGDIPGAVPDRQSAQPDRGAAMLFDPPLMRPLQQQDLRLEPCGERGGRLRRDRSRDAGARQAGSGCARGSSSGKSSMTTGPLSRSSSRSAARITRFWNAGSPGGPKGRPSSNGTQSARGGLVFSVCGRIRLIATVAIPSSSR